MPDEIMDPSERESLLRAYLDHELPSEERSALEETLSDADRTFLHEEQALMDRVKRELSGSDLSEKAWIRIRKQVRQDGPFSPAHGTWGGKRWLAAVCAAAVIFVLVAVGVARRGTDTSDVEGYLTRASADTVEGLAAKAEVPPDREKLIPFLSSLGLEAHLDGLLMLDGETPMSGHVTRFLGAMRTHINGEACAILLLDCCGDPIQIVLAPSSSTAASAFALAMHSEAAKRQHMAGRVYGSVSAFFIGSHDSRLILNLLDPGMSRGAEL
ncbi:MAG: hypothetical protein M5U26_13025 [Planctomycetota bacterium]|nr:hypothetical protein [Planctomycetota bacterium]